MQDQVFPLSARLKSIQDTLNEMKELNETFYVQGHGTDADMTMFRRELESYIARTRGDLRSVELLEKRSRELLATVRTLLLRDREANVQFLARSNSKFEESVPRSRDQWQHIESNNRHCKRRCHCSSNDHCHASLYACELYISK